MGERRGREWEWGLGGGEMCKRERGNFAWPEERRGKYGLSGIQERGICLVFKTGGGDLVGREYRGGGLKGLAGKRGGGEWGGVFTPPGTAATGIWGRNGGCVLE